MYNYSDFRVTQKSRAKIAPVLVSPRYRGISWEPTWKALPMDRKRPGQSHCRKIQFFVGDVFFPKHACKKW